MIPLILMLRQTNTSYKIKKEGKKITNTSYEVKKGGKKINCLLFMDDLKVSSENEDQIDSLVNSTEFLQRI